ncbi:hypothetical protein [Clostridium tertium]|uniref:hypothetical protein n=1 Tax=Clostridium tertium TaxID=1559 RepID=UPI0024B3AE02|nr:hypothetical protein [Clostridium tertium]MDI9216997.1 hypothetical protein [Clostridium tertium]
MFYFLGVIQLIIILTYLFKSYKKIGLTILGDSIKLMFILWISNIALYNLQLSKLYNPNWPINIVVFLIAVTFFIASKKLFLTEQDVIDSMDDIKSDNQDYYTYSIITTLIFIVASIVFWLNVSKYGLAILGENKINKQPMDHYSGYIVYMLVLVAQIKYILFRSHKKISELILFILSLGTLILTLNRGPLVFILFAIYIYEIFNLIKIKDSISKKNLYSIYGSLIAVGLLAIVAFGYIGDMRMEYVLQNVYNRTIHEHYQMNKYIPSGFLWAYIYLTSPLENAAFSIMNQGFELTYFNNLFYPFIKLFANIAGNGAEYKSWLMARDSFTPYLEKKVGLNVSSFVPEAMQDLSYFGVIIYVCIFLALAYFGILIIKKKKFEFSTIGSIAIYANILSILCWSVFVNSLKVPVLILNILFLIMLEILRKYGVFKFILKKLKRG